VIKDEDKFCDMCRRDSSKRLEDAYDEVADNDDWLSFYSSDNMNY